MSDENIKPNAVTKVEAQLEAISKAGITNDMLYRLVKSYTKVSIKQIKAVIDCLIKIEKDIQQKQERILFG